MPDIIQNSPSLAASMIYQVKNVAIGALPVKTIVPITATNAEQAIAQAQAIADNPDADIAKFRIDMLDFAQVTAAARQKSSLWGNSLIKALSINRLLPPFARTMKAVILP